MAYRGIDDYLTRQRERLARLGQSGSSREANKRIAAGPQGASSVKKMNTGRKADSGVRINPKNVQVTRTGLERRKRALDQRSTRGYGGRRGY